MLLVLLLALPLVAPGGLSLHMVAHILTMNVLAPIVALMCPYRARVGAGPLWLATLTQSAALWFVHAPALQSAVSESVPAMIASHLVLFGLAIWFWTCVVAQQRQARWHAIGAMLLTGKLACLLGVLLIFAPYPLYRALHDHGGIDDQAVAGLLMIAACPPGYVLPAILTAVSILADLPRQPVVHAAPETR